MAPYDVANVNELPAEGRSGTLRKVRRALGLQAFGANYFVFPPDHEGHEHDERESRHEEVFFCVSGAGHLRIDGEVVELRPGTLVRIDPDATRCPVSSGEGMAFLMVGAPAEGRYEPPSWG